MRHTWHCGIILTFHRTHRYLLIRPTFQLESKGAGSIFLPRWLYAVVYASILMVTTKRLIAINDTMVIVVE